MSALKYHLVGNAEFIVPPDKLTQFDAARLEGQLRLSVEVELPKNSHTVGFDASDIVSGSVDVRKVADNATLYSIKVDAVVSTLSLGKKEAKEIASGKATCQFWDIGYGSEWYPEMQFQKGGRVTIKHVE